MIFVKNNKWNMVSNKSNVRIFYFSSFQYQFSSVSEFGCHDNEYNIIAKQNHHITKQSMMKIGRFKNDLLADQPYILQLSNSTFMNP